MPTVCPEGDLYLLLAGIPHLVITHGIQLTGEPVVSQLRKLLCRVDAWASHYSEQAQPIRLLALWLDKLLRLAPSKLVEEGCLSVLHLTALNCVAWGVWIHLGGTGLRGDSLLRDSPRMRFARRYTWRCMPSSGSSKSAKEWPGCWLRWKRLQ